MRDLVSKEFCVQLILISFVSFQFFGISVRDIIPEEKYIFIWEGTRFAILSCVAIICSYVVIPKPKIVLEIASVIAVILCCLSLYTKNIFSLIILSGILGIIIGIMVTYYLKRSTVPALLSFGLLVSYISTIPLSIPSFLIIVVSLLLVSMFCIVKAPIIDRLYNEEIRKKLSFSNSIVYLIFFCFVGPVSIMLFWQIVIPHNDIDVFIISFCIFLLLFLLVKGLFTNRMQNWYLFLITFAGALGFGYFYTFDIKVISALFGSIYVLYYVLWSQKNVGSYFSNYVVLISLSIMIIALPLTGWYLDDYYAFVFKIGIPKPLALVGTKQSIIKEATVYMGFGIILSGILYLKERRIENQ